MPSEVQICNLALSHLGDSATVSSIDPPEGSAQAEHCQNFYPVARDSLLEMHDWSFTTRRGPLAPVTNPSTTWAYCYAAPAQMLSPLAVLDPAASDDYSVGSPISGSYGGLPYGLASMGAYTAQPFVNESLDDDTSVIFTNQVNAVLRYTKRVTDTTKFSALFVECLHWSLAGMLAGPIIKGDAGMAAAARCQMIAFGKDGRSGLFGRAIAKDANDKRTTIRDRHQVAWIAGR